ncbi:MAG: hypothetical protein IPP77_01110 [Bacteroidetes bacterium]|nr:hypothetical protein [Bacteroidota bacterium]
MVYRQFYSELGKLLYAVADVDGVITQKEKKALKEMVRAELVPEEEHTDKFGTDVAFYAEIEFDILEDSMIEAEDAFESFIQFIENHHSAINQNMRDVILKIAVRLADAYHKTNKKEKALLEKLERKLKALPVGK